MICLVHNSIAHIDADVALIYPKLWHKKQVFGRFGQKPAFKKNYFEYKLYKAKRTYVAGMGRKFPDNPFDRKQNNA